MECLNKVTCIHHEETTESQPKNQIQYVVPDEIVSYGLGNFAECLVARYQLALLVAVRDDLQVPPNSLLLYDPKFLSVEKDVLTSFGFQVLKENEEAKRCCERPTLFYMPHCGKSLYNNLLFANWSPDRLCHVVIIGNLPSSTFKRCAPLVMNIQTFTKEVVFPGNFQYQEAKRCCERPTLFYMPHCGKSLYNNLLFANWSPDRLCHVVIIGNNFTNMVQKSVCKHTTNIRKFLHTVELIQTFTEEVVFPGNFQYQDVIHVFPKDNFSKIAVEFWEDCSTPTYDEDDLEFFLVIQTFTEEVVFPGNFQYQVVFNDTVIHDFPKDKLSKKAVEFWEDCSSPTYDEDDLEIKPKSEK
ncbi:uncharacterized protein [Magallana gigas]|uniref:uncharacterized protein n=1 Tax=Magallana gigas TaxID=29159 RepID=UPI0033421F6F